MAKKPDRQKKHRGNPLLPIDAVRETEEAVEHMQLKLWEFAANKAALGFFEGEIAEMASIEFKLKRIPHRTTVRQWLEKAKEVRRQMITDKVEEKRMGILRRVQLLLRKWMPIATLENLQIMRFQKVDGETIPVVDEDAYDEQIKASRICIDLIKQEAALEGIDVPNDPANDMNLSQWIGQAIINSIAPSASGPKPVGGIEIEPQRPVLELETGDLAIDSLK